MDRQQRKMEAGSLVTSNRPTSGERSASDPAVCADDERNGAGSLQATDRGGCMVGDEAYETQSYGAVNRRERP